MTVITQGAPAVASVNGVSLNPTGQPLPLAELRQRACSELLRQAAVARGLLTADDAPGEDGVLSAAATQAIEALLDRELVVAEPSDEECRRYHAANPRRFAHGARVHARHILFAVTPGVDVEALRQRAEACLSEVSERRRDSGTADEERFARRRDAVQLPERCPRRRPGLARSGRLRTRVRTRGVQRGDRRRSATFDPQPLRPARGRGAGARRCGDAGLRRGARRTRRRAAPRRVRHGLAPLPRRARRPVERRRRRPGPRYTARQRDGNGMTRDRSDGVMGPATEHAFAETAATVRASMAPPAETAGDDTAAGELGPAQRAHETAGNVVCRATQPACSGWLSLFAPPGAACAASPAHDAPSTGKTM